MKIFRFTFFLLISMVVLQSSRCRFPYSFTGSGRKPFADSVTVSVLPFVNSAPLAKATFPNTLAEGLRDAIQRQTRLKLIPQNGDLNYEGTVTGYAVTPVSISAGGTTDQAAMNRLTITVHVKYTDAVDDKYSFEADFSRYSDFPSTQNLSSVEDQLIKDITDQLVQDIMNKSINAW